MGIRKMGFLKTLGKFFATYKTRIIIAITVISVLSVAGAVKWYGVTEYRRGVEKCTSDQKTGTITTLQTNNQIWKEVQHANSKITDLDGAGVALGIMRADDLR